MVENLSMPDLLKDVISIYFFCRALPIFFREIAIFTAEHAEHTENAEAPENPSKD